MQTRPLRLMGRSNRAGEILIRLRAGLKLPLNESNPYLREACDMRDLILTAPELEKGFPGMFADPQRAVWADVGCYFGETLADMAVNVPDVNFLGVDIRYKRVVKSGRRLERMGITNARIVLCDAGMFLNTLPAGSLAGISVFFPDPWPREKHRKHRFLNREFLHLAASRCRPGALLWFKTDQEEYFNDVMALAPECGFHADRVPPEILGGRDYDSVFQRLFKRSPEGVFQAVLSLKSKV
ncbi:MAG TPA: hypothetical protein ENN40_05970 [Candidatus Aminicenantes bacterium]|nr:hypothetical protein [Candidatus Aminicenantes bacterium]